MTVVLGLADWKPAVHAPWAASCALEPAPFRVPLSLVLLEDLASLFSLPAPQADKLRAMTTAAAVGAAAARRMLRFTSVS